ncbi:MAG: hypothetical protein ACR2GD_05755, partial [Pyrinomonadaceae bacterium]
MNAVPNLAAVLRVLNLMRRKFQENLIRLKNGKNRNGDFSLMSDKIKDIKNEFRRHQKNLSVEEKIEQLY